ncbi:MAG: LytTR family DNA-binding domain-containing protein [Cyclobacteriaceae bacterium]|nr:LytTR family transcriptional regulator [Cyclobacteriaceae bacterium]
MILAIPSFSGVSNNTIRRALMVALAFIMTHLISYQHVPFTEDYRFPVLPFAIFVIYGIFICETNTWNFKRLSGRFGCHFDLAGIWRILKTNLVACTAIFIVLSGIQMLVFRYAPDPFRFISLLSICLLITTIETAVFIVLELVKSKRDRPVTLNQVATKASGLIILRGNELIPFGEDEIAYLIHKNGCVFLVDKDGNWLTTQFESLGEIEEKLSNQFFRANRQVILSRFAIRSLKKDLNGKLRLEVSHLKESVIVSRYRSKNLKQWYVN